MKSLILTIGIPASGKSTAISKFFPHARIISPDSFIGYTEENPWTFKIVKEAWATADECLRLALQAGETPLVFDATFVEPKRRKKYVVLARQNKYDIYAFYCRINIKVAQERNSNREKFRQVPNSTLTQMESRLVPPALEEGFRKILIFDSVYNELKASLTKEEKESLKMEG